MDVVRHIFLPIAVIICFDAEQIDFFLVVFGDSIWNAGFLADFVHGEASAKNRRVGSEKLKSFAAMLQGSGVYESITPPSGLKCELRPYQKEGLNWLQFLGRCQLTGVLAMT